MSTEKENKVYLFQNHAAVLHRETYTDLEMKDIVITPVPNFSNHAETSVSKALANFIHMKKTGGRFGKRELALSIQRMDPRDPFSRYNQPGYIDLEYQVLLDADFLQDVCQILPRAFLEVEGTFNTQQTTPDVGKLCERLELQEILAAVQINGEHELTRDFSFAMSGLRTNRSGRNEYAIKCSFNITIGWYEPAGIKIKLNTNSLIQNLFENEDTKDLSIIAGNGTIIKCHKFMFAAQSSVLSKMVTCGMTESKSGKVEMLENSEEGVKLLLRYLYGLELSTENLSSDLVVELLQVAHKYDLAHLESSLSEELLQKDVDWFTPDTILELYFYIQNVEGLATLRDHSLKIMTMMSTQNLSFCEGFKKLNPSTAINLLCKLVDLLQIGKMARN